MAKLGRTKSQRKALLINLCKALFLKEKIRTTESKAKQVQSFSEKLITKAKQDDVQARRELSRFFPPAVIEKLMKIASRYKDRPGGYTRVLKLGPRESDRAEMAIIELV